ncbi:hypothetical protein LguiA_011882 [Lonicera macranthoides]
MLQWMGGSRRKVTTSRMSTQKRQKQYFEQRKRQQQQQQTFGQESYSDKPSTCNLPQNNNRSLDILSLLNLSPVIQQDNSSCPSGRRNLESNGSTLSYQTTPCPPTIQKQKVSPIDPIEAGPIEFTESRTLSGYQGEIIFPKKSSFSYPDSQNKALNGDGDSVGQMKLASSHQLSVLDLLGDDGNSNSEGNSIHEAHVAFSVEGLGKVETETPVQSPQQIGRTVSYGCSSPSKVTTRAHLSNNLNCRLDNLAPELDTIMQHIDMPFFGNSPFYSRGTMDSYSNPKPKICAAKEFLQFNNLKNTFSKEEAFYNHQEKNEHKWNENSSFLDDNFLDQGECGLSWKNWHSQADSNFANYLDISKNANSYFNFEGPSVQKKRSCAKATGRFNILESPTLYPKHQISQNDRDFTNAGDTWHTPSGINCDVKGVINKPPWPFSKKEEERDSWSLLSEESCSSSAVRDQATEKEPFNTMLSQRRKKHSTNHRKYGLNTNAKETNYRTRDNLLQREDIDGPVKSMRISNPSTSVPSTTFKKISDLDEDYWFEEKYTTGNMNSGFDSFCRTSGTKESPSSRYRVWTEDPFGANAKLFSERSKHDVAAEYSPCDSSFLNKPAFWQPNNSFESPIFPNIRSDSRIERKPRESFHVGCMEDKEFSNIPVEGTVNKDGGKKPQISPPVTENFELEEDVCNGSNGLSTENGMPAAASDSEYSCSHLKEVNRTPETKESAKTVSYSEHAEETSSSVEIPDKFEASIDGKEGQIDSQSSLPWQTGFKEMEDSRAKESSVDNKGISNNGDTSCRVMMLESYVLQLLCMQVLKDATSQSTEK